MRCLTAFDMTRCIPLGMKPSNRVVASLTGCGVSWVFAFSTNIKSLTGLTASSLYLIATAVVLLGQLGKNKVISWK